MRWILLVLVACGSPPPPKEAPPPPKVLAIPFHVDSSNLTTGDEIEITTIHGDRPGCVAGGTYQIAGRYLLTSRADAELVVSGPAHEAYGEKTIARGPGEFQFTIEIAKDGPISASFMKAGGGSAAGGIVVTCDAKAAEPLPGAGAQ
jgi:hypothetical protein